MKYLGIDWGSKRVGVALSDENGTLAFPREVLASGASLVSAIKEIVESEEVGEIVLGESRNSAGEPNAIMKDVNEFKKSLEAQVSLPVHLEPEFMTSMHAAIGGEKGEFVKAPLDASAAALILQRFLDKQRRTSILD